MTQKVLFFLQFFLLNFFTWASPLAPQGIVLQGTILKPSGAPVIDASVDFTIEIRSSNIDNCLLYLETHTLNMSGSGGAFSLALGSGVRGSGNFHDTSTIAQVFTNSATAMTPLTCFTAASSYSPLSGDSRKVVVTFDDGSGDGPQSLSQSLSIQAVPYAFYADKLEGKASNEFIQVNATSGKVLTQSNLESVFASNANVTELLALINGTSSSFSGSASPTFSGAVTASGGIQGSTTPGGDLTLESTLHGTKGDILLSPTGGNVGIGTSSPSATLEVNGRVIFGGSGTNSLMISGGNNSSTGADTTFVGVNAGISNTTGINGTFLGSGAGRQNTSGNGNTFIGKSAGELNTIGTLNTFVGLNAGYRNSSGVSNVIVGQSAGFENLTGSRSVAVGRNALNNFTATGNTYNVALGESAMYGSLGLSTGIQNTSLGGLSGNTLTSGNANTFIGYNSGSGVTSGSGNIIIGSNSGSGIATSSNNIILSDGAGNNRIQIDSSGRVGVGTTNPSVNLDVNGDGRFASESNWTSLKVENYGNNFPSITLNENQGSFAAPLYPPDGVVLGMIAFNSRGSQAATIEVDTVGSHSASALGTKMGFYTTTAGTLLTHESLTILDNGNVGVGSVTPGYKMEINGHINILGANNLKFAGTNVCSAAGCTSSSDSRLKRNVSSLESSLEKVLALKGVEYDWINTKKFGEQHQIGLIAQDVEKVFPEVVITDPISGLKSLAYDHLVAPIIEAIKEMHLTLQKIMSENLQQDAEIQKLKDENAIIKAYLCERDPNFIFCKKR